MCFNCQSHGWHSQILADCICICVYMCECACMCVCVCVYVCVWGGSVCVFMCVCVYTHTHTHTQSKYLVREARSGVNTVGSYRTQHSQQTTEIIQFLCIYVTFFSFTSVIFPYLFQAWLIGSLAEIFCLVSYLFPNNKPFTKPTQ